MVKHGDFIKLNYTGKLTDGTVFDTTDEHIAKKEGLSGRKAEPVVICVGEGMLLKSLDDALVGKEGKFSVHLSAEKAFGKKDPKQLRIIPTAQLHKQQINPFPGLQLNVDGSYGVVRSVSGGRTVVDFNHPLASQDVVYDVEIIETVTDPKEQVKALLEPLGIRDEVTVHDHKATIKLPTMLPKPYLDAINSKITKLTTIKTVSFEQGTPPQ